MFTKAYGHGSQSGLLGCDEKTPQAGWLKTTEIQLSRLWRLEAEIKAPAWSAEGRLPGSRLLAVSHMAERGKGVLLDLS